MNYSTGKLAFIFMLAVLLSYAGAWWVARRYRLAMRKLMSAPMAAPELAATGPVVAALPEPAPVSAADNRRAGYRLALLLVTLSGLISLSSAALQLHVVMQDMAFSLNRLALLGFVQLWPVIPSLGLLWRWPRWRVLGALALWFLLCFALVWWRSDGNAASAVLSYLAFEIGPPMLLVAAVCLGGATRAIAPWLLLPVIGLVWASQTGLDLIALMIPNPPNWFLALIGWLGARPVMALFALLPWLLAWWPLKRLGRALARAYTRKTLSELMVLFTAVWGISLLAKALMAASDLGLGGAVMLLPLLWVPVMMAIARRLRQPRGRPPTLLVLRVFQHDARIQALFDEVIERWRLTGNTVLIAGTDLIERTLDADDIFTFIDGRLASRFIQRPADVAARLAAFDLAPDAEGRFRINACYCHDTTWQPALAALVQRVFQHDARIQALFDEVIERWRLTGNTVLIAGTDLIERTLDADDIFTFIDGRLASRFIQRPADVAARLAAFDLAPDAEGRFRINECYCHDTTWQPALAALVERSDVVLMDLRSFKSHNQGCRHELGVLSHAARIRRVVVLTDGDTDRAAALSAIEAAPQGRFVWLDTSRPDRAGRREVLESLFGISGGAGGK